MTAGLRVVSVARYWTNRPGGTIGQGVVGSVCSLDQSDQVSSGSATLPVRTWSATDVPVGRSARQDRAPKRLIELGIVDVGDEAALVRHGRARAGRPRRVARADEQVVPSGSQQRQDLAVVEPGNRRRLLAEVADLVELPLGSGPHEQAVPLPGQGVDQRLDAEDLAGYAVRVDPVDRVIARPRQGGARAEPPAEVAGRSRPGLGSGASAFFGTSAAARRAAPAAGRAVETTARSARRSRRAPSRAPSRRRRLGGRAGIEGAVGAEAEGADLALGGVVDDRRLAVGGDAVDQPLAVAAGVDRAVGPTATQSRCECLLSSRSDHLPSADRFQS